MEILSRLPLMDVIRARCVSKTWSDLISHPHFAQMHLSTAPPSYTCMAPPPRTPRITRFVLADVERDHSRGYFVHVKQLNPRFTLPADNLRLDTSCNELLCLVGPEANDRVDAYVCNPVLGEYTTLPEIVYKRYKRFILGFGFTGTRSGGYKVLQCVRDLDSRSCLLQVHKLCTSTWNRLQDIHTPCSRFDELRPGTFLDGSLHCVDRRPPYKFCSFDLQSEQLKPFPGPNLSRPCLTCLRVSGGLLCLLCVYNANWCCDIELWMMKQYGVKESWTNINTMSLRDAFDATHSLRVCHACYLVDYGSRGGDELGKDVLVVFGNSYDGICIFRGNKRASRRVSMPGKKNLVVYHFKGEIVRKTYGYLSFEALGNNPANMATSLVSLRNIVGRR